MGIARNNVSKSSHRQGFADVAAGRKNTLQFLRNFNSLLRSNSADAEGFAVIPGVLGHCEAER
jgi:hypothetical protein